MKILNLYACLGGNRFKWDEVTDIEVTAVELDPELAKLYKERFPNDTVIVGDAHQYLLEHYQEFDFIWSSPPCPSHSRMRKTNTGVGPRKNKASYPDMSLYQQIILLTHFYKGKWVVENVIPYYEPLIPGQKIGRHLYWSNFKIPNSLYYRSCNNFIYAKIDELIKFHHYDFKKYKGSQRIDKIARNLVDFEAGKSILCAALDIINSNNSTQEKLLF